MLVLGVRSMPSAYLVPSFKKEKEILNYMILKIKKKKGEKVK